jgi:Na+/H+ antiporter NhaD/arsenite permease-like protein
VLLTNTIIQPLARFGPLYVLAAFYLFTAVLTETMSNNTAAVLLAPIALSVADLLGVSPRPLLVAITFAASTSFATPIGYQTNTMIYAPGGYHFFDYTQFDLLDYCGSVDPGILAFLAAGGLSGRFEFRSERRDSSAQNPRNSNDSQFSAGFSFADHFMLLLLYGNTYTVSTAALEAPAFYRAGSTTSSEAGCTLSES